MLWRNVHRNWKLVDLYLQLQIIKKADKLAKQKQRQGLVSAEVIACAPLVSPERN